MTDRDVRGLVRLPLPAAVGGSREGALCGSAVEVLAKERERALAREDEERFGDAR